MASPALLAQRTTDAIQNDDAAAFARWTRHPRWRIELGWAETWVLAAVGTPDPIAWLERLENKAITINSGGYRQPTVCEAARLGRADVVGWLLDRGAHPTAVSDYGMGRSLGYMVLEANAQEVMDVLWKKTNRMWSLLRPGERKVWLDPSSLPMLKAMHDKGWSSHHQEPDEDAEGGKMSFVRWVEAQDTLSPLEKERLLASLEEVRMGHALPTARQEEGKEGPVNPRIRI